MIYTPINIEDTALADYYSTAIKNTDNFTTFVFQKDKKASKLIYSYFTQLQLSDKIKITKDSILFVDIEGVITGNVSKKQNLNLASSVVSGSLCSIILQDMAVKAQWVHTDIFINKGFYCSYVDNPSLGIKNQIFVSFTPDLFSPFLPINPKTYKYDPESKYPNPDWEHNTKIMYEILEYPLKHFKFIEGYRHIKDADFEYYTEEQLQANLKKYVG